MDLSSIFSVAAMAVASCTLVHIGFGLFGVEGLFHWFGDEFGIFNLSELFGIEGGGHFHGGEAACGTGVHDHNMDGFDEFLGEFPNE